MNELVSIGRFARMSGLTIDALRRYDELGLLRPARVDPDTGYRRYVADQLEDARRIGWLRSLDLPLDRIAAWLAPAATEDSRAAILRLQLAVVEAQCARVYSVLGRPEPRFATPGVALTCVRRTGSATGTGCCLGGRGARLACGR